MMKTKKENWERMKMILNPGKIRRQQTMMGCNILPFNVQNRGGLQNSWRTDSEIGSLREITLENILKLIQKHEQCHAWGQRLANVIRWFEERLFNNAMSKGEYMNPVTLKNRLHRLIKQYNNVKRNRHLLSPFLPIRTLMRTPGVPHSSNASLPMPSHEIGGGTSDIVPDSTFSPFEGDAHVMDDNDPYMRFDQDQCQQGPSGMLSDFVEEFCLGQEQSFAPPEQYTQMLDLDKNRSYDGDPGGMKLNATNATISTLEDEQSPPKRVKIEHSSTYCFSTNGASQMCQQISLHLPDKSKGIELLMESSKRLETTEKITESTSDGLKDACKLEPVENIAHGKQENVCDHTPVGEAKMDIKCEITKPSDHATGTKVEKPKIKGLSLTELFTLKQIKEHINSLGTDQCIVERAKAMGELMNENSCQLCAKEKIFFEVPHICCSLCGDRVKRNGKYYATASRDERYFFCNPCFNQNHGETFMVVGVAVDKAGLKKYRNDYQTEEAWVQCDKCRAWQHQICALFNGKRNEEEEAEYTCPYCYMKGIRSGELEPLPQSVVSAAKDLPRTILSDHIEQRLFRHLKQEREKRAKILGKNFDEVPGAEGLVVRVVSSVDKKLQVKPEFRDIFKSYPREFPYKSKAIVLFQNIQGVDVCIFSMFVQEFGSECHFPNQRRVYLSYLDSVKYFTPEIKTVNGETLRTVVYHEILIGYLDYCKERGFTSCYIWASPPSKGDDYILYCHPKIQMTPKSDKLREWYLSMLNKATKEKIVVDCTNLYDHFFTPTAECKAKVTATRLPYFDGDYLPGAIEGIMKELKGAKNISALMTLRHANLSENVSKDMLLMQKLGESIHPMKENFIMVHLQHACTRCCELKVPGKRWICNQCKKFQLCHKCHDAEGKYHEKKNCTIKNKEKHLLCLVEVNDVPLDTKDKDGILDCGFFDTRHAFLNLCQLNHYQFNTLRQAKHSSMMVLYHLHNPTAPTFMRTCIICFNEMGANKGWRCEICPEYDVCDACYSQGGIQHKHNLTHRLMQAKEVLHTQVLQLQEPLDLLVHACKCYGPSCNYKNCHKVKQLFHHGKTCKTRVKGGCKCCKKMWILLQVHSRGCKELKCSVPRCNDLRDNIKRLKFLQHRVDVLTR